MKSEVKCISSNFQEAYLLTQLMSSLCEPAEIQTLQNEEAAVLTAIRMDNSINFNVTAHG